MSTAFEKIEKRRIYMRNYRLKKAGKLNIIPIKEVENEDDEEDNITITQIPTPIIPTPIIIPTPQIQKEKIKFLLIKPDFTLLIKNNKQHRILMRELLRKTAFIQWLNNYDRVMNEFIQKKETYIEYRDEYSDYEYSNIRVLVITTSFIRWLINFDLVMEEFVENQL
jgi:hypothetical protein